MAVFRVERNSGYTVMSNHHLRNKELTLKAKGLLSQMLSLPEDWDYTLAGLSHINRESIDAIRTAVRRVIGKEEIRKAIEIVGLNPDDKKHVGKYSLGMKQRLGLAQAIMENPDILILDEPMNGLDKEGVSEIRKLLLDFKSKGKTIIIVSHNSEDINMLCDTVHEMDKGRLVE